MGRGPEERESDSAQHAQSRVITLMACHSVKSLCDRDCLHECAPLVPSVRFASCAYRRRGRAIHFQRKAGVGGCCQVEGGRGGGRKEGVREGVEM